MSSVMVVENNGLIRTMYVTGLTGFGYNVLEASSIAEAKSLLQAGAEPDVILLDLHLPDAPGHELIRYIRNDLKRKDIRIIVATGMSGPYDKLVDSGADMLLIKPIELVELLNRIQAYTH